ncbi:MAG TPA: DUF58 domain-containing protein [Longimicrobiaceae bacterium]
MTFLPARRLLLLLTAVAPLFLVSGTAGLLADLLLLAAAAVDARRAGRTHIGVSRTAPARLAHGEEGKVTITVENIDHRPVRVRVTDDLTPQLRRARDEGGAEPTLTHRDADSAWIPPGAEARFAYRVRAVERGRGNLGDVYLRLLGPLGLVWYQRCESIPAEVRVQPGLRDLRRYRLLAHRHRLSEMGLRAMRQPGEGSSFESLREYVRGDDPRRLDWKASGKHGTLIVRQTETERSQNVLLTIDAGRLMTEELSEAGGNGVRRERIDSALAAALLLAEVAAQHGDRVGLFVFSDQVHHFFPPARAPLSRLVDTLSEIEARLVEPDYPGAFAFLGRRLRRRSLIVLFTDVIDARASSALLANVSAATRRHLPLAVAIRNPALERVATAPVEDESGAYRRAAAEELLLLRNVALATMRRAGVLVADTTPERAVPTVVNRYLEVKRRGRV